MILVIVFDLEGVLIDNSKRYFHAISKVDPNIKDADELPSEKKRLFWENFINPELAERMDTVNVKALKLFDKYLNQGKKVVIISGTKKEVVSVLLKKLKQAAEENNLRFKPHLVVWRPDDEYRKAPEFKLEKIKQLASLLNEPIECVYDDNEETVKKLKENGINAILWGK